ncbi:unnamed protein product [Rotaria sp. Silwood1]|nr:unnamed protein product [Rotaria sp. Silwood1]
MEKIEVTWPPILNSCQDDFIGIYFVETPILTVLTCIFSVFLSGACDYIGYEFVQNQTSASWDMVNLRRPLEFRYYSRNQNCSGNYSFAAKSSVVQPLNYNEPTQIHLAYGNRIDQMFVSLVTNSNAYTPRCQYGLNPSSLEWQANGTTLTYTASDMCEGRATIWGPQNFIDPGFMHTILLNDLHPSTTYFYRVGTDEDGWSSVYSFTNRPANGDSEVILIAYGDMGLAPFASGAKSTIDRVRARVISTNITCLLHIGDISYAMGIAILWDSFMTQIESIASHVPYMVSIGNHEYDHVTGGDKDPSGAPGPGGFRPKWGDYGTDSGGECAVPMVRRFHSPSNGNGLFWYSFDVGPIHFVIFSAEHDFHRGSSQYIWLEQDLQSVNRSRTPWLIVSSHRPMYSSQIIPKPYFIILMLQLYLEPLFYKYHVDINLYAHIHSYERTCPMYQHRCVDDGITQILIGMAGQDLVSYPYTGAEWSIYHDEQYGYTQLWANRTYLKFTYYHDVDDAIADEFVLKK